MSKEIIAIIDTETNWYNRLMSIGVVLADSSNCKPIEAKYFIIEDQARIGGMYSNALLLKDESYNTLCSRTYAINEIIKLFQDYNVSKIFAYNANFDKSLLGEFDRYNWYDIMRIAIYKQYNNKISDDAEVYSTGRLKRNYGVESILRLLSEDNNYHETHNGLLDALDELKIMELLNLHIDAYEIALLKRR